MPEKMVVHSVVVTRDGERITPPIGKPFDFTDAEIKTMLKDSPMPFREVKDESEGMKAVGKGEPVTQPARGPEMTSTNKAPGNPLASRQTTKPGRASEDEL